MENTATNKVQNEYPEEMEGVVKRIIFKNQVNNYSAVAIESGDIPEFAKNPKFPKDFVSIGYFPRLAQGQRIKLFGKWKKNATYGWQLIVEKYEEISPTTESTMVEYLSSGLFKGIGKKTAENIVDTFGLDSLKIIKEEPGKLSTVNGISAIKASAIIKSYKESEHLEKLMMSLKPFKISTNKIVKIYQFYGDESMDKIILNPYRLCDDIHGIGFKIADSIARSCNKSPNDDFRLRAAIIHTLNEAANAEGNVFLPFDLMVEKTQKTLQESEISGLVEKNDIIRVAIDLNNLGDLFIEKDDACYLPIYYSSEINVAHRIQILASKKPKAFRYNTDTIITELEKKYRISYAENQKKAFRTLSDSNIMVITGGPGTGKTTIIKGVIDIFKRNFPGSKISLCAPTGRAAKRMEEATGMEAKTIHRLIEYRPNSDGGITCGKNESNQIETDIVIIDESSMIELLLFSLFLKALPPNATLILVGDIDQLPSVGAGNVLKDLINSGRMPVVYLNKIFRQKNTSKIIINSAKINHGDTDFEYGEDFVLIEEANPENIPQLIKQSFKRELKRVVDINEVQVLTPFRKKTENGVEQLNITLQEDINPKYSSKPEIRYGQTTFRKYDKVMQYKNNYDKEIYNGDTGIIENVNASEGTLVVRMDDEPIDFFKDELCELQLSYASTIHKAQGCEYDTVIIPLSMQHKKMLQRKIIYTGITRAKKKVVLIGDPKALNYAVRNNKINDRFSKLDKRIK